MPFLQTIGGGSIRGLSAKKQVSGILYNGVLYVSGQSFTLTSPSLNQAGVYEATVQGSPTLRVTCKGARGSNKWGAGAPPGYGGNVTGTYVATPAGTYKFVVGKSGADGGSNGVSGGYPGGGYANEDGAPGGGFTGWWRGSNSNPLDEANRSNYLLIGGAGAGSSSSSPKDSTYTMAGGYPSGGTGTQNASSMTRAQGGSQSGPGAAQLNMNGQNEGTTSGSGYTGGNSGSCGSNSGQGGAGGGGYYGGGGGNSHCGNGGGGGGGGSSYYDSSRITNFVYTNDANNGDGHIFVEVL